MNGTGTTRDDNVTPFQDTPTKAKQRSLFATFKKVVYFAHFIIIAICTTHILIKYPHARQFSFTLCALVIFGYMAIWTIMVNFIFLVIYV